MVNRLKWHLYDVTDNIPSTTTMALWTGFPAGVGIPSPPDLLPTIRKPLKCRAKSEDFERKLLSRFAVSDEVETQVWLKRTCF